MRIMDSVIGIIVIALAIGAVVCYKKGRQESIDINEEVIDSELMFDDVVSFFKSHNLNQNKHVPFIANGDCEDFRKMLHAPYPKSKEGYNSIFIGIYDDECKRIIDNRLLHCKSVDPKILEILGDEKLVVLS